MKKTIKVLIPSAVVFFVLLSILPAPASASFPPEWVGASGVRITTGTEDSGDYQDTFYYDITYHVINAIVEVLLVLGKQLCIINLRENAVK